MAVLAKTVCIFMLVGIGNAVMLGEDDPVRRHPHPQSAGSHGDGFVHRSVNTAVYSTGAASLLELDEGERFKVHMKDLIAHGMHRRILEYSRKQGWACETTGNVIDVNMSMVLCKSMCDNDLDCTCYQFDKQAVVCSLQKAASCESSKCKRSGSSDVYIQKAVWAKDPLRLIRKQGVDCRDGKGATELDESEKVPTDMTLRQCKERCGVDEECTCFKYDRTFGRCHKMKDCRTRECAKSGTIDTYLHEAVYNGYEQKHNGTDW